MSMNQTIQAESGWVDSTELKLRGIVASRTTLHRYLNRPMSENPFPRPHRHTKTGRRYWRYEEVAAWHERELARKSISPDVAPLVPDGDPSAWRPGRSRRSSGDVAAQAASH